MQHPTRYNSRDLRRTSRRTSREGGFSLIELMVVITIIGLLSGIVGVNVYQYMKTATISTTKTQIIEIENAIETFRSMKRRLPDSLDELVGDEETSFLNSEELPTDAWSEEFIYEKTGSRTYNLISLGADKAEGGDGEDADIDRKAAHRKNDERDQ